jgi:hypothetical protein
MQSRMPEPDERSSNNLARALGAIQRAQTIWLVDLSQVCLGDVGFLQAFRRWEEQLTALKLHIHRAENRLLHFMMVPHPQHTWREFAAPEIDRQAINGRWTQQLVTYFRNLHLDTSYRRLQSVLTPEEEEVTADIVTDIAAVAEVAETTMPSLRRLDQRTDPSVLEDLAFFHVISPWKQRGLPALLDVLRWLSEFMREHEEL